MTAVGNSEPQPDSTSATPRPSPGRFSMQTWERNHVLSGVGSQEEQGLHSGAVWARLHLERGQNLARCREGSTRGGASGRWAGSHSGEVWGEIRPKVGWAQ